MTLCSKTSLLVYYFQYNNRVTVTKDTNLGELVKSYPQAGPLLLEYGLHCVGCFANTYDSIEMGARVHGMTDEEVEEMIGRVNDLISEGAAA